MNALTQVIPVDYMRIEGNMSISGFVISKKFRGMPLLDRQRLIADALDRKTNALTPSQRRSVLMIAGLTPEEYEDIGTPIGIREVREEGGGAIRILLDGDVPDAEYVEKLLAGHQGVETTEIEDVDWGGGGLIAVRARGKASSPISRAEILRLLKQDPYIEVLRKKS